MQSGNDWAGRLRGLGAEIEALRARVAADGSARYRRWRPRIERAAFAPSALNLAHYLGFRETGKPRGDVQFELVASLEDLRWAAAHAEKVLGPRRVAPGIAMANFDARLEYLPLGVAGVIAPWNFPVYTVYCGLAYALAAGNAAVVKPSEFSSATGVYAAESFAKANPDAPDVLVGCTCGSWECSASRSCCSRSHSSPRSNGSAPSTTWRAGLDPRRSTNSSVWRISTSA